MATGASVVYENRNLLNIASEVPEPPPPPTKRRAEQGRTSAMNDGPLRMLQRPIHVRYGSSSSLGLPDIARNIFDRSESLGINRTVMNAVSEIKVSVRYEMLCQYNLPDCSQRNLPDLSASFNSSQYQPASFPMLDGKPTEQRPSWETRSRFEVEKEMADLKKLHHKLGDSLEWILEALSQEDHGESTILRKRQALESLAYVKHVLKGPVSTVDDTRLFDEKALKAQENPQDSTLTTIRISQVSGHPPLPSNLASDWLEGKNPAASQANDLERPRGLGHSSSSPSLGNSSSRSSAILPRTPWTPVSIGPTATNSSAESTLPKPPQRSASSPSRPIQTETSAANPPIQHDPLGVL